MCYLEAERRTWCCSSVVGWILIFDWSAPALTFRHPVKKFPFSFAFQFDWRDFQLFILWWWFFFYYFFFALPLLAAVIRLKSPFSDQFPRLNLWGARRLYVRLERGVKLFSRQCDGVSRRCFSAKQKINIYWQDSEGFFFLSVFLFGRICVRFACKDTRHTVCFFWFQSGERRFIQPPSCCFFLDYLPVGARLWATNPHGR